MVRNSHFSQLLYGKFKSFGSIWDWLIFPTMPGSECFFRLKMENIPCLHQVNELLFLFFFFENFVRTGEDTHMLSTGTDRPSSIF